MNNKLWTLTNRINGQVIQCESKPVMTNRPEFTHPDGWDESLWKLTPPGKPRIRWVPYRIEPNYNIPGNWYFEDGTMVRLLKETDDTVISDALKFLYAFRKLNRRNPNVAR